MIGFLGIAPPREHLELGARIRYHHRCAVARWQTGKKRNSSGIFENVFGGSYTPHWRLFGGANKNAPIMDGWSTEANLADGMTYNGRRNKTIFMWPEEGEGVVIGLIRRGIGESVSPTTSFNGETTEYEEGYFAEEFWIWLYAVKTRLEGTDYILVPMDAVEEING
jgi:outer membrane receptor for monomeric catechols